VAVPLVSLRISFTSSDGLAVQSGRPLNRAFAAALAVFAPVPPFAIATVPVTFSAVYAIFVLVIVCLTNELSKAVESIVTVHPDFHFSKVA
jgi:hypothetical protein